MSENCTCCAIVKDNEGRTEPEGPVAKGFFLSGLSFGMLNLAENLPLRLCAKCKEAALIMMKDLAAKFEKVNGYALGADAPVLPKGAALN